MHLVVFYDDSTDIPRAFNIKYTFEILISKLIIKIHICYFSAKDVGIELAYMVLHYCQTSLQLSIQDIGNVPKARTEM